MTIFNAALGLVIAGAAASAATAQTVYRCGNSYSQVACTRGQVVDAADPRTEAEVADARRVATEDRRLAARMEHDRLADEAARAPTLVVIRKGAAHPANLSAVGEHRPPQKSQKRLTRSPDLTDPMIVAPAPSKRRARA